MATPRNLPIGNVVCAGCARCRTAATTPAVFRLQAATADAGKLTDRELQCEIDRIDLNLSREIVAVLGYDPVGSASGPDRRSDHRTVAGLHRTLQAVLGNNPYDWEQKLANKELYNKESLGRRVFLSLKPLLSRRERWLRSDHIKDVLVRRQEQQSVQTTASVAIKDFVVSGPYEAGYVFTSQDLPSVAQRYAFLLNAAAYRNNTTPSSRDTDRGSHWVVMYVDGQEIDYFDSLGHLPSDALITTMESIVSELCKLPHLRNLSRKVLFSETRKQPDGDLCAVYVVHFVMQRLAGISFAKLDNELWHPNMMEGLRRVYWKEVP